MNDLAYAIVIAGMILCGLHMANAFYDYGTPQYLSRKAGHGIGGVAYLLAVLLYEDPWWPLGLSVAFTCVLIGARLVRNETFRGVGGSGRSTAFAEVWFPIAGTVAIIVGWVWLDDPSLALLPILFMAWGDLVTGVIRANVYGREVKGNWGSLGMIVVCLTLAWAFFDPFWIGAVGALVATIAEKMTVSGKYFDDNYTIILSSLVVMSVLT